MWTLNVLSFIAEILQKAPIWPYHVGMAGVCSVRDGGRYRHRRQIKCASDASMSGGLQDVGRKGDSASIEDQQSCKQFRVVQPAIYWLAVYPGLASSIYWLLSFNVQHWTARGKVRKSINQEVVALGQTPDHNQPTQWVAAIRPSLTWICGHFMPHSPNYNAQLVLLQS